MTKQFLAAVFDMDGTLIDNMHVHQQAWKVFLERHSIPFAEEDYHAKNTGTILEIIPRFFPDVSDQTEVRKLGMEKESIYREIYAGKVQPLKGLPECLKKMREAGLRMALATAADKGNIDFTIDALGIRGLFDAMVGSEDVRKGKPDPDVYLRAADKLGLDPADCLAFEDSHAGIQSALNAGMTVVGVATTLGAEDLSRYRLHAIIRDYVIEDLPGFLKFRS